jgi:hypothetical protein
VPPIRVRNSVAALALTLTACSSAPQHRVEHADGVMPPQNTRPASVPAEAVEVVSAPPATPVERPANPGAELADATHEEPPSGLATECHQQGGLCLPPSTVVDRLCRTAQVSTAIRLFAKSSPLTRAYVRMREVRAANLRGGPVGVADLTFAEEVLILAQHGDSGEMQVSGTGGFDVLRWDGTCATLSDDELVLRVPAPPRHAQFAWNYIDENIQQVLLQNQTIKVARADERKRCHGMSPNDRSPSCREAAERLNEYIVVAVRTGVELPLPEYAR